MSITDQHRAESRAKLSAALRGAWTESASALESLVSQAEEQFFSKAARSTKDPLEDYNDRLFKKIAKSAQIVQGELIGRPGQAERTAESSTPAAPRENLNQTLLSLGARHAVSIDRFRSLFRESKVNVFLHFH